jgi:hypothetical protein
LALVLPDLATPRPAVLLGLDEDVVMVIAIRCRVGPVRDLAATLQGHGWYLSVGGFVILDAA